MRGIYRQFLKSENMVVDALSMLNLISSSQHATLKKMQFLIRAESDACNAKYGGEPVSSVYSVELSSSYGTGDFYIPVILSWDDILLVAYSHGICRLAPETRLIHALGYQYNVAASLKYEQLHRLLLSVEAISENGVEWYSVYNNEIIEVSKLTKQAFRLPWLAKRNVKAVSPVDLSLLSTSLVISANNDEVSFQHREKIVESKCPNYVGQHSKKIVVCDKGLILRSKQQLTY